MAKKRKHSETEAAENAKKEEIAPERPKRTLFGFKKSSEDKSADDTPGFRNKEKVLVTCSRRISFRFAIIISLLGFVNLICGLSCPVLLFYVLTFFAVFVELGVLGIDI